MQICCFNIRNINLKYCVKIHTSYVLIYSHRPQNKMVRLRLILRRVVTERRQASDGSEAVIFCNQCHNNDVGGLQQLQQMQIRLDHPLPDR